MVSLEFNTAVWDAGNGAAGEVMARLTARLPGRHILINETVDGRFPAHHPDPTVAENLDQLKEVVLRDGCDLGIGLDGDGDRIGVLDGKERILWADQVMAILVREVLREKPGATIIADVKASQILFDEISRLGGSPLMWRTGHSLIKAKMAETGAPFAGEMSGHIFFADRYFGFDDALYAAVRLSGVLARSDHSLAQIRDGLHIFGQSPGGERLTDLLVALTRIARGPGIGNGGMKRTGNGEADGGESLLRALGLDLGLDFDPLDVEMAGKFKGPAPAALIDALNGADDPLRTYGDGIERLEALAKSLIDGTKAAAESWRRTRAVLGAIETGIRPAVEACGRGEIEGLLSGLDGRFVVPGPSGAPTRGRPDVLPTGRNFYSVDTRTVPTPAAWRR